jgi:hypothetical protein
MRSPMMDRLEQRVTERGKVIRLPVVQAYVDRHHRRDVRNAVLVGLVAGLLAGFAIAGMVFG